MATSKKVPERIEFSLAERAGINIGGVPEAQPGVIRGYLMAREPELVARRKVRNAERIKAGSAQLLADLG